jgi:peroxiredoxin
MIIGLSCVTYANDKHPHTSLRTEHNWKVHPIDDLYIGLDVPFYDKNNRKVYLEDYEGKTILLAFWATWCSPCTQEMIDLDVLQKDFRKLGLVVIPISEDYNEWSAINDFYTQYELRYLDSFHDDKNTLFSTFGVVGMPTSFIINFEGKTVAKITGIPDWSSDSLRQILFNTLPGIHHAMPKNTSKTPSVTQNVHQHRTDISKADTNNSDTNVDLKSTDVKPGNDTHQPDQTTNRTDQKSEIKDDKITNQGSDKSTNAGNKEQKIKDDHSSK